MKAIMYHYVRPEDKTLPDFKYLHLDDFIKQLDFFEKEYGFVSKEDFLASLNSGKPAKGIVLTFDDGVKDHYNFVAPELARRNLWALFFVCTGIHQSGKLLDVHRIHMLLGRFGGKEIYGALQSVISEDMLVDKNRREFTELTYTRQLNDDYSLSVKKMLNYFIDYKYRDAILEGLITSYYGNEEALAAEFYVAPPELAEMQHMGMIIGSHTISHPVLSKLSSVQQREEIEGSFNWLSGVLGQPEIKSFCYPYGGFHSFTTETEQILNENKVSCSFNVEPRDIEESDLVSRKTALPRYDCNQFAYGKVRSNTSN
ncbi:MAG TPA: polysaccharide deacetylase family protein [Chitinophagaceae bacterium]|nr:polysaccharide deacetylase family protein [Chitinophagaceae bacterium]